MFSGGVTGLAGADGGGVPGAAGGGGCNAGSVIDSTAGAGGGSGGEALFSVGCVGPAPASGCVAGMASCGAPSCSS